jgi:hypothetical protein
MRVLKGIDKRVTVAIELAQKVRVASKLLDNLPGTYFLWAWRVVQFVKPITRQCASYCRSDRIVATKKQLFDMFKAPLHRICQVG